MHSFSVSFIVLARTRSGSVHESYFIICNSRQYSLLYSNYFEEVEADVQTPFIN